MTFFCLFFSPFYKNTKTHVPLNIYYLLYSELLKCILSITYYGTHLPIWKSFENVMQQEMANFTSNKLTKNQRRNSVSPIQYKRRDGNGVEIYYSYNSSHTWDLSWLVQRQCHRLYPVTGQHTLRTYTCSLAGV